MRRALILAAVAGVGSSLAFAPGAAAELRVGKNFRMSSDLSGTRGKDQLGMAVNPNNPQHIVAVHANYLTEDCEGTRSLDGGQTWSPAVPFPVPAASAGAPEDPNIGLAFKPSCRISDHLAEQMYQTVAFGSGQDVYATYVTTRATPQGETSSYTIVVKSTDGGLTWGQPVIAMAGGPQNIPKPVAGPYYELPTVSVERGAAAGGADRVYVAAREITTARGTLGDVVTAVSNDGAQTFSAPVDVDPAGENVAGPEGPSEPVIQNDGDVYIAWRTAGTCTRESAPPGCGAGILKVARSTDAGATWSAPVNVAQVNNVASNSNTNPPTPLPANGSTFPRLAVDRTSGPSQGNLYLVYNQGPEPPTGFQAADHFIPPDTDVYIQRGTDDGANWSAPQRLNDATVRPGHESPASPPEHGRVTQTRHPTVSVAPNGRVDVVWQDRRHWYRGCIHTHVICDEARLGDTYYAFSANAGGSFSADRRISDRSHNNDVGFDYRFGTGWAFGPVTVPLGNDQLLIGWMDSREGNFEDDAQDIYLARADHNGPSAVPQENVASTDTVARSVELSKLAYPGGGEGVLASTFATRNGTRVVIANQGDVAGTLAAGVLARATLSQVLLAPASGLPESVKQEVTRLNPDGAFLIGGANRLSDQVVADLQGAGVPNDAGQIVRLGGASDAELARQIAERLDRRSDAEKAANNPPAFNAAVIVNPASPDAGAVSALAAARRLPILFAGTDSVPAETTSALGSLDIDRTLVVGGSQWVGDAVMGQLPNPTRLGGADQYATSRAVVAESRQRGLPTNIAYVADGENPMDGALLGSAVGRLTGLLMLSPAPLTSSAPDTAAANDLTASLDRMVLFERSVAPRPPDGPQDPVPPGPPAAFGGCASLTANVIFGTAGANSITGTPRGDRIFAAAGDDRVDALGGNDCVDLGPGADRGQGGSGNDLVLGGLGGDRFSGSSGNDRMRGGAGNDRLTPGRGNDRAFGDAGNDSILASFGNDVLHGVGGNDRLEGSRGRDRIRGGSGNDRIAGGSSPDNIRGDRGGDRISGNSGKDRLSANSGNDRISARDGERDRVSCGGGRDRVIADRIDRVARDCERVRRRGRR